MFKSVLVAVAAAATLASAQRPSNTSICDYYTKALTGTNNATNQYTVLTLVVNRAVIGNTSATTTGIAVPGILNPNGTYNGTAVNLVPYFSGALKSSNRGGSEGVSVNFLDGGGAAPIAAGMPANDTSSNQYTLLTHLYEFFGDLLGCSDVGMSGYPAYAGQASMYSVHKFMVLDSAQMAYFITQVGLSAASFGVATSDVEAVGAALEKLFDYRCSPATTVIPSQGAQLQSICTASDCMLDSNATCSSYQTFANPNTTSGMTTSVAGAPGNSGSTQTASGSNPASTGSSSGSGSGSGSGTTKSGATREIISGLGLLGALGLGAVALL